MHDAASIEPLGQLPPRRGAASSSEAVGKAAPWIEYEQLSFAARVRADARRHGGVLTAISTLGFWVIFTYRVAHELHTRRLDLPARGLQFLSQICFRCDVSRKAVIGPGTGVFHASGIFIGPHVRIGRDCTLGPEIFIGANTPMKWDDPRDYPVIGDGVALAPGAKILGRLSIGAGTRVGPNAVVMRTVPPKSIVAAPPCRVISADAWRGSTTVEDRSAAAADAHRAPETPIP